MDSLPEELLISIFSYLKPKDIIAISLTCKRFSEVINCSQQLVSLLTVYFSKATAITQWIGSREYSNVMISEGGVEAFLDVRGCFSHSVKKLSISIKDLKLTDLTEILKLCPNIKELEITEKSLDDGNFTPDQLPSLNLNRIKVHGGLKSLKILENCQTKELEVCWRPRSYPSDCKLADFLVTKQSLKVLRLENFSEYFFQFPQNLIDKVQFRLEKLSVRNSSDLYILTLKNFVDLHVDSLQYLELDSYGHRESQLLQPFTKLKSLKFNAECSKIHEPVSPTDMIFFVLSGANQFPDQFYFKVEPLPQIKVLEILNLESNFVLYSEYFPNVEELSIGGRNNSFFVDVEHFKKLEILIIRAKKLTRSFRIPKSLKKLKLFVDVFPKNEEPFTGCADNEIDELIVEGNCDLNFIEKYVEKGS